MAPLFIYILSRSFGSPIHRVNNTKCYSLYQRESLNRPHTEIY